MRIVMIAVVALSAAGCRGKTEPEPKPAPPKVEALVGTEGLDLATSSVTDPAPAAKGYPNRIVAYDATRGLVVDGQVVLPPPAAPTTDGFDAKDKRGGKNDLFVTALGAALAAKPSKTALVALEASTPYAIVVPIAFTLGQSEVSTFDLLVKAASGERRVWRLTLPQVLTSRRCDPTGGKHFRADALAMQMEMLAAFGAGDASALPPSPTPTKAPPPPPPFLPLAKRDALCLTMVAQSTGVTVRSGLDRLDATCIALAERGDAGNNAPGVGSFPLSALGKCTAALKATFPPEAIGSITVTFARETPWRHVVGALDAAGPPSGFETPSLGLPM